MQHRGIAVCLVAPGLRLGTSGERAEGLELRVVLLAASARDSLAQRPVGQEDVVLRQGGGLVGDLMSAHLREVMRQALPAARVWCGGSLGILVASQAHNDACRVAGWTPVPAIR